MTEETNENGTNSEKSSSKIREKSHKWDKAKVLKKVIIRRLPPSMTEEIFLKQIEPLPDHENYYFVPADWSLGQDATARAYINFVNQDDIFLFKDRFDGYVFVDNKGAEYPAVVEFAPFQGMPRNKSRKKDPKAGTIESDLHYISFLESLSKDENEANKAEFKLEYSFQLKDDKKITSTPLLQYLATKKQERRDERKRKIEEKRRQREEERTRTKTQPINLKIQVARSIPPAIAEEDSKEDDNTKEKLIEKRRDREKAIDDRKESRNRRRDQKRKEERERKTQEARASNASERSEMKLREEEDKKKKESKKYSLSRREKLRSREESRRADAVSTADVAKESSTSQPSTPSIQSANSIVRKTSAGEEINENVLEFITSCKEFVPRSRSVLATASLEGNKSVDTESGLAEVRNKLEQLTTSDKEESTSVKEVADKPTEKLNAESTSKTIDRAKERAKRIEERNARRIRNKDRPSIEIYQPRKMRLSTSTHKDESGRSSVEMKDYKSNPTSDCESVKQKDEKAIIKKKVSRYSERRSGRAKDKQPKEVETKEECISEAVAVEAELEGEK